MAVVPTRTPLAVGRTAEVFAWNDDQVLKLFRPGWGMAIAAHEAEVARALYAAGVPMPRVDDVIEVDCRAGVVYERISGPSLLAILRAHPQQLRPVARMMAETHARMHERSITGLPRLREVLAHRIQAAPCLPTAHKHAALDALDALPDGDTLCHGDYHPDNVLLSARGPLIIDWENAALGDPLADVARTLLLIRAGAVQTTSPAMRVPMRALTAVLNRFYLRRYRQLHPYAPERLAAWELPVTAARLSEGVDVEEVYLLARIHQLVRAATSRI